jgi:phage baseplate assembly protein W
MSDAPGIDLKVEFSPRGGADIAWGSGEPATTAGLATLEQSLILRLVISRGDLEELGHPRYGSLIHELIGEPLDPQNLELLRRYARQALKEDPRVEEVSSIIVRPRRSLPGVVDLEAAVVTSTGDTLSLGVAVDLG